MSNHLISAAYKADVGSLLRKAVLVLLADKASDDGQGIWASKQTLADELCCSKQSVINTIHQFENEGLIKKIGERPCRNGHTTEYLLVVPKLLALPHVTRWKNQSMTLTGQPDIPVNGVDRTSQRGGPKPSLNRKRIIKESAREIEDDWKPDPDPKSETAKFMATWPPGFQECEVERFVAYHRKEETKSKNFNRQWATWALGPYCRRSLKEWNDERPNDGQSGNAFAVAAASFAARSRAGTRPG